MSSIVVAYDGSPASGRALSRAAELARMYETTLVVTSVTPVVIDVTDLPSVDSDTEAAIAPHRQAGTTIEVVTAIGEPSQAIVEVAERHGAALVVVGTGEPSVVERMLGFSVSENVQRRAHCDVLLVH
jgi:nucleotide-binding universal stress UspA family protein